MVTMFYLGGFFNLLMILYLEHFFYVVFETIFMLNQILEYCWYYFINFIK